MKNYELHRGRLIDHVQLVVKDLAASKRFYMAAFEVLGIPLGGRPPSTSGSTSCSFPAREARTRMAR